MSRGRCWRCDSTAGPSPASPATPSLRPKADARVGREYNHTLPNKLQEIQVAQYDLLKAKRIKTDYRSDAPSLADLYGKTEHPVVGMLLQHREVARLKSVVDGLLPLV